MNKIKQLSEKKQITARIRQMFNAGVSKQAIQDALGVTRKQVNNTVSNVAIRASKSDKEPVEVPETLYSERDMHIRNFYSSLNVKGALLMSHIEFKPLVNTRMKI